MSDNIKEDISFLKNELESLTIKVDQILDMLNNFTIMIMDMDDDDEDDDLYDTEDSWVPEENSWDLDDEDDY